MALVHWLLNRIGWPTAAACILGVAGLASAQTPTVLRVDATQTASFGSQTGGSWALAFRYLQDALDKADDLHGEDEDLPIQIWVRGGTSPLTYYPDEDGDSGHTNNDKTESFFLRNFVSLYGGFDGTESLLTDRDPETNVTILDGDLDDDDVVEDFLDWDFSSYADNSYHVVQGWGTDETAGHSPRFPVSALS